jgi:hypothetical protein
MASSSPQAQALFGGFRREAPRSSLFPHMLDLVIGEGLSVFRAAMLSDDHYQDWLFRVAAGCLGAD